MFRFLRTLGGVALWIGAGLGVLAGLVWLATAAGLIQPLIVISGSMEPTIDTGDLLIATKADTAELEVGDVVSLHSDLTHRLVTHRIVSITPLDGDRWEIEMKGDANPSGDVAPYVVGDQVWKPGPQLPGVGYTVSTLMQRGFVVPAMIALGALLGLSLLKDDDAEDHDEPADRDDSGDGNVDGAPSDAHIAGDQLIHDRLDDRACDDTTFVDDAFIDDATVTAPWPPPKVLETASP